MCVDKRRRKDEEEEEIRHDQDVIKKLNVASEFHIIKVYGSMNILKAISQRNYACIQMMCVR